MQMTKKSLNETSVLSVQNMTRIAVLSVISMVLMFFKLPTWFAPSFLKIDISDMPSLIGAFSMGPMAGVLIQLLKNILNLITEGSMTAGVGEFSNFLVGSAFIITAGNIYKRNKTQKTAIISLIMGVLVMTVFSTISNYFVVFPLYGKVIPLDEIVKMAASMNSLVVDFKSLILFSVVPFNLLKGTITSIVTLLMYKRVSPYLKN